LQIEVRRSWNHDKFYGKWVCGPDINLDEAGRITESPTRRRNAALAEYWKTVAPNASHFYVVLSFLSLIYLFMDISVSQ
jgi:hypothetical protein